MNLNSVLILVLIGLYTTTIYSQKKSLKTDSISTHNLDEVIVSATRTVRQLSSIPLPATLISKKELKRTGVIRLNEILNEQTGITTIADESGFNGIQIQGISSDYVLILIDGVPLVGRSAGNFDLSRLAISNIKQIEIVKGPSSSLYGSEALGGVINIITEKPKQAGIKENISYRLASFNTHDANIYIQQKKNRLAYSFYLNTLQSDGYDLEKDTQGQTVNPFKNYTLNGQILYDVSKKLKLFTSGRYYQENQDTKIAINDILYNGESTINEYNSLLRLKHNINDKLNFEYELYYTNYKASEFLENTITGEELSNNDYDQILLKPEIRAYYTPKNNHTITSGIGYNYETLDRTFFDDKVIFNSNYLYAQYDFYPIKNLNTIIGARFDNHSKYKSQFSPKFSTNYKLNKIISIKSSIGYGFKAPDFRQLYFDFTNASVGYTVLGYNVAVEKLQALTKQEQITDILFELSELKTPLNPESSIGYNLGVSYKKGKLKTELNLFRNDFKNLIDTHIIAKKVNGQNVFSYKNFHKIYTTGIEVSSTYKVTDAVTFSGGYQLLYAKDKDKKVALERGEVFARNPQTLQTVELKNSNYFGLVNRSRHTANFKIYYDILKWNTSINLRINYRSKYALFDSNGNGIIDTYDTSFVNGYAITNLTLNKVLFKKYTLQIGANNLFNYKDEKNIPGLSGTQFFTKINLQF